MTPLQNSPCVSGAFPRKPIQLSICCGRAQHFSDVVLRFQENDRFALCRKAHFVLVSGETSQVPEGFSLAGSLDKCGEIILSGSGVIICIIVTI